MLQRSAIGFRGVDRSAQANAACAVDLDGDLLTHQTWRTAATEREDLDASDAVSCGEGEPRRQFASGKIIVLFEITCLMWSI